MTLKEIYRLALARNLTAKQAGAEYNCRWDSLHKVGAKHKMPKLLTEYEMQDIKAVSGMTTNDLQNYKKVLENAGQTDSLEYTYCNKELSTRKQLSSHE